jgi:hypothetical protein
MLYSTLYGYLCTVHSKKYTKVSKISISIIPRIYKFKFFINKESSIRNMHVWKNAQMTRTNKRIKQGNTSKIKIMTILQLYQRESYPNICRLYINNTLVYIYIYKHESALLVIEHKYIQLLIW